MILAYRLSVLFVTFHGLPLMQRHIRPERTLVHAPGSSSTLPLTQVIRTRTDYKIKIA
jgi:hypothetical protein